MAVYSRLLLSTGGGIISSSQQAEQTPNTATVLIGLGGTGVHCIRTIKTQVYNRLKPDDPDAVVPTYQHIRFLGVDTTEKSRGGALSENQAENDNAVKSIYALNDTEFFSIANQHVARAFRNPLALQQRSELSWLEYEDIEVPNLTDAGAGGLRQIGRFMMMDRSQDFMNRLEQEISAAKLGLTSPRVNVHIFAGLSGGTGSGCFLDVCYMVKSLADRIGAVTVFGYFFLPDVNLSTVPYELADVRSYIPKNGYAAMQELDYCMGLPQNGGSFEQMYQGHKIISWDRPPVDMCHLVCATDKNNNEIPDAYNYAMNVTAEYVLDFLTDNADTEFGLTEHLANFRNMISESNAKKTIGSNMAYCVIGASSASVPLREINTYLASELFDRFGSIKINMPRGADVEQLAINALALDAQSFADVYDSIYREVRENAQGEYPAFRGDYRDVRDYGNKELMLHYTNETSTQKNLLTTNIESLSSETNADSLINRIRSYLVGVICDINRGPIYAYKMLDAAKDHNLLNLIVGLIKENNNRWGEESAQTRLRSEDYEDAKADFEKRPNQKRFNAYEYYLMLLEQHKLTMTVYKLIDELLTKLRKQVEDATASYYIKLSRVMGTLLETFADNKDSLASGGIQAEDKFSIPMMTIDELKDSLNAEIARINIPGMLDKFMRLFVDRESDWITEDENRISHLVTEFFVNTAFGDFANRTITRFLKDKYEKKTGGMVTNEQLTEYVYNDWMKLLTEKASPLFYFNQSIWQEGNTSKIAFLSFPETSDPIKAAAIKMNAQSKLWGLKESALTDRIFVMCSAVGLPLASYNNCSEYESNFYADMAVGRHYYEGKPVRGTDFCDWRKLPSVTPQCVMSAEALPLDLANLLTGARDLFDEAKKYGVIDDDGYYCAADPEGLEKLKKAADICKALAGTANKMQDIPNVEKAITDAENVLNVKMERVKFHLPTDGHRETMEDVVRIQKDHFIASPATHSAVKGYISEIKEATLVAENSIGACRSAIGALKQASDSITEYCDALFTDVVSLETRVVVYHRNEYGIQTDIYLSKRGEEFPFNSIPIYQGYVSFQALDKNLRAEIKKIVDERMDADAPEIKTTGDALKKLLKDDRMTAMAQLADNFSERNEIIRFLGEVKKRFNTHCLQSGI